MQFTAVFIKKYIFDDLSLNDVCVFIPAWFGVLATFVTGLLAYEVTLERNCCNSLFTVLMDMLGIKKDQEEKIVTKRKKKNKKQTATKDIDIDIDIEKKTNFDLCCYIPIWFGVLATIFTAGISYETSLQANSSETLFSIIKNLFVPGKRGKRDTTSNGPALECATFTAFIMSVLPAHLMRSLGGGFDNECVAMTAMTTTFYFWCRSLRAGEDKSFLWGIFTGLSYFYVSAT